MEVVKEVNVKDGVETSRMPFLMLGLDLPPPPLFKDVMEKNIIPQVCVLNCLVKFLLQNGSMLKKCCWMLPLNVRQSGLIYLNGMI